MFQEIITNSFGFSNIKRKNWFYSLDKILILLNISTDCGIFVRKMEAKKMNKCLKL